MCRKTYNHHSFILTLRELPTLTAFEKRLLEERYISILIDYERRCILYALLFHTCRILVTIGSLIVPALLSIQYTDTQTTANSITNPEEFAYQIYWATWVVSLLVTTSNGIFTLFKVDKKYYSLHAGLEQLRSEGWQFLQLSGRFSGFYTPKEKVSHANQFIFFCHRIEKIKMRQVQDEYAKLSETHAETQQKDAQGTTKQDGQSTVVNVTAPGGKQIALPTFLPDGLIPPTPLGATLQQIIQALSVDGGQAHHQPQGKQAAEPTSEMPVRSKVQANAAAEPGILRQTSAALPKAESSVGLGAEISAAEVESKSKTEENT